MFLMQIPPPSSADTVQNVRQVENRADYLLAKNNQENQLCFNSTKLATIAKKRNKVTQPEKTYDSLQCSAEHEAKIHELITTLGSHGKLTLLMKYKSHLEKIGDEVRPVYPLKFLACIYKDPKVKRHMRSVLKDYFKRSNFIGGLAPSMKKEQANGNLKKYIGGFVSEVYGANISTDQKSKHIQKLMYYIDKHNWLGMLEYLAST